MTALIYSQLVSGLTPTAYSTNRMLKNKFGNKAYETMDLINEVVLQLCLEEEKYGERNIKILVYRGKQLFSQIINRQCKKINKEKVEIKQEPIDNHNFAYKFKENFLLDKIDEDARLEKQAWLIYKQQRKLLTF